VKENERIGKRRGKWNDHTIKRSRWCKNWRGGKVNEK